jgi:hypothetical protein
MAVFNPDKGFFSGCGLETIAGLKVELGLERVDLVGGNGRDDVNESIDCGSWTVSLKLGQIDWILAVVGLSCSAVWASGKGADQMAGDSPAQGGD